MEEKKLYLQLKSLISKDEILLCIHKRYQGIHKLLIYCFSGISFKYFKRAYKTGKVILQLGEFGPRYGIPMPWQEALSCYKHHEGEERVMKEKIKKNKLKDFLIAALISFLPTAFIITILRMMGFNVGVPITGGIIFIGLIYLTLTIKREIKNKFSSSQYLQSVKIGKLAIMLSFLFIVIPLSIYASKSNSWMGFLFLFFLSILIYSYFISLPVFIITFFITAWVIRICRNKAIEVRTRIRMSESELSPGKDWQKYYEIREEEKNFDKLSEK